MRLTAVKLAGFKSFVEPTTIKFPSNLMGIVGPNGCGKSNIIDAVRWVMGESSARQLRGESMSDVIFSGSSARKPVATATVELVFDNSDGRAGGEYASYNEISVKRQVSRDGHSNYFLNGTRCRRKDITDLFLGTGLGPRSYAIIEQGMISQIVEARPEELRAFLEEAAGISRYKERRRETENRIRHTRENLERLADLREEVGKQLAKLQRQARAAERYRKLKARYRDDEARFNALKWRQVKTRTDAAAAGLRETENRLQETIARQRGAEKKLEALRQAQHQAGDRAGKVQGELYEVGGRIARLEQDIEHQRELRKRQQAEHAETSAQLDELKQHLQLDRDQVEQVTSTLGQLEPELAEARQAETEAREAFEAAEQALTASREALDGQRRKTSENRQQAELLRLRIEHLDERMGQAADRLRRLGGGDGSEAAELDREIETTAAELAEAETARQQAADQVAALEAELQAAREGAEAARDRLESARAARSRNAARLESLKVLNRPQGEEDAFQAWLAERNLDTLPRLLERLDAEDDWQPAAEAALGAWLEARVLESGWPEELPGTAFALVDQAGPEPRPGTLAEKVAGAGALTHWLNRIHTAPDVAAARAAVAGLENGETVITPNGTWMGRGWASRPDGSGEEGSALARQREIRRLESELEQGGQAISEAEAAVAAARESTDRLRERLEPARQALETAGRRHSELAGTRAGQDNRKQALARRRADEQQEIDALGKRQQDDTESVGRARADLEKALEALEAADARESEMAQSMRRSEGVRDDARQAYRTAREAREAIALKLESARASLDSLRQAISRMDTQIAQLQSRHLELSEALGKGDAPVRSQEAERDRLLAERLKIEERLRAARAEADELEEQWRQQDQARQQAASEAEEIREEQSRRKLELRELEIEGERLAARVVELGGELEALVAELPEGAETEAWAKELAGLDEKIRRLEPVNLAAIDEFRTESERKDYLDRQHADLVEALETLESAIGRIDRTTRTRFRETFERVNRNMEQLFPRLFGGGHGYLEMVGDDWLTAGTAILARPPGKRVSRIHLLSGGEKALTAVAFVFAIFNLNPAPFCLLDEVDAPLDDANVGRFSELVREMSERVQFVMVTHNKVTMEAAHQMLGVTMREPGISRLVSVDLERAVALAAS